MKKSGKDFSLDENLISPLSEIGSMNIAHSTTQTDFTLSLQFIARALEQYEQHLKQTHPTLIRPRSVIYIAVKAQQLQLKTICQWSFFSEDNLPMLHFQRRQMSTAQKTIVQCSKDNLAVLIFSDNFTTICVFPSIRTQNLGMYLDQGR